MDVRHEELSKVLHCEHLEVLTLQCLVPVNERTLESVSEFCPVLRKIDVSLCPNVAGWGVLQSMKERGVVIESYLPPGVVQHGVVRYQI